MGEMLRSYSEMISIRDFVGRYRYLRLGGGVGDRTFGSERYLNQRFYTSRQWADVRREVIIRDNGDDLAMDGFKIATKILIHHINPMTREQILDGDPMILDPENLISVSHRTHNAIHYGDEHQLITDIAPRREGDTTLWLPMRRS